MKKVKDHYYHKAKTQGFVARSAYKLQEIDQKHKLLKPGFLVLDLGCAPGSWSQYASQKVGENGLVVGIDRNPAKVQPHKNLRVIQADLEEELAIESLTNNEKFDLVLSDMAPNTSGIKSVDAQRSFNLCELAVKIAQEHLKSNGALLVKILQGGPFPELLRLMRERYKQVNVIKPKSSRDESKEIFVLGRNRKNNQLTEEIQEKQQE